MNNAVDVFEKRIAHRTMPDWHQGLKKLQEVSRAQRYDAYDLRNMAIQLRNETTVLTKWDTIKNNDRLQDRIFDVDLWRDELVCTQDRVQQEIFNLNQEKMYTEKCMESLHVPLSVISECLSNRDSRRITETTTDYLEEELKKELLITEKNRQNLSDFCRDAWESLSHLDAIKSRLQNEIANKSETLRIDEEQLNMNLNSSIISYKPEPFRVLENSITIEGWLELTKDTIRIANAVMADSKRLRENLFNAREQCANELLAQKHIVDHGLRKRIYETQRSRNELQWQRMKTKDTMSKTATEISMLQNALVAKINVGKLVETRAENRTYRPTLELVRDRVSEGLQGESYNVRQTMAQLHNKIEQMKATYNALENLLGTTERELDDKEDTLQIDSRCIEIRVPLAISYQTQTHKNIELARIQPHQVPY